MLKLLREPLLLTALVVPGMVFGQPGRTKPSFDHCFDTVAVRYTLDPNMLRAIAMTETGMKPHLVGPKNKNGSYDIGLMQINSGWLKTLGKYGITEQKLFDACTNIHVGAWILAHNIAAHGPRWKAVGAYNAVTPSKQVTYVEKVQTNYKKILKTPEPETTIVAINTPLQEIVIHTAN